MKILSIYYTHKPGGFCARLYRLLNALSHQAGHEVLYLALDNPPGDLLANIKFRPIPFITKRRSGLIFWISFSVWAPIYVAVSAVRYKPDRYVVFGAYYSCIVGLAKLFSPAPIILFLRSLVFRINRVKGLNPILVVCSDYLDRIGIALATKIVCMTQAMTVELNSFSGRNLSNIALLPNDLPNLGTDTTGLADLNLTPEAIAALSGDKLKIVTAGVLDRRKNIELILKALLTLRDLNSKIACIVVGAGSSLAELKQQVISLGLTNVYFTGWCSNLGPIYRNASVVVHPALHEGMPNAVMEGLALGLPVLGADTPELRELLFFNELLFSPVDESELGASITKLIKEPNYLNQLRALSHKRAQEFTFDWDKRAIQLCVDL